MRGIEVNVADRWQSEFVRERACPIAMTAVWHSRGPFGLALGGGVFSFLTAS
jgi:hypothetical protein